MSKDKIDKYWKQCCLEIREIIESLNQDILKAEADPEDSEILNACFRGIHTIKGSAGTFRMDEISDFAHHIEEMVNAIREKKLELTPEMVDLFLEGADHIEEMLNVYEAGDKPTPDMELTAKFIETGQPAEIDVCQNSEVAPEAPMLISGVSLPPEIKNRLNRCAANGLNLFRIYLNYTSEHLENGYDPLPFLKSLKSSCEVYHVDSTGTEIPQIESLHPYEFLLKPIIYAASTKTAEEIADLTFDPELISVSPMVPEPVDENSFELPPAMDAQSMREFIAGSFEMLESAENAAIEYEESGDPASLNEIFRVVHNIKGDSDYIGIENLAFFAHELESLLERLRSGKLAKNADIVEIVLRSLDHLKFCIRKVELRENPPDAPAIRAKIGQYVEGKKKTTAKTIQDALLPEADEVLKKVFSEQLYQYRDIILRNLHSEVSDEVRERNIYRTLRSLRNASAFVDQKMLLNLADNALNAVEDEFPAALNDVLNSLHGITGGPESDIQTGEEPKRIGEILVAEGKITEFDLKEALASQMRIGEILIEQGKTTEEDIGFALKKQRLAEESAALKLSARHDGQIRTMRVDETKVEAFSNLAEELLIARNTYDYLLDRIAEGRSFSTEELKMFKENLHLFSRLANDIHFGIMSLRMIPVGGIFRKFLRMVRDISRKQKKSIDLVFEGEDIEIDKKAADALTDPLVHLVRNACDHGIETLAERLKAGKPEKGRLLLKACQEGSRIRIIVKDDGKGIDREALFEKAKQAGACVESQDDADLLNLIFLPGLSTRSEATDMSGRGVGMDVVGTSVKSLGGSVSVVSDPGKGTEITMDIPMSMGIENALLIESGNQLYAFPLSFIEETLKIRPEKIRKHGERMLFHYRGNVLPLAALETLLNGDTGDESAVSQIGIKTDESGEVPVVIAKTAGGRTGIMVNRFRKNMEIAVKPMPEMLRHIDYASGVSIMGDGKVILLVNPEKIRA